MLHWCIVFVSQGLSQAALLSCNLLWPAGELEVQVGKETKTFGITRAHLEEDAGQNLVYDAMCA